MPGMQVTPRELRDMDIREGFRGYNRDEVDELLERAAQTIEELQERIRKLSNQLAEVEAAPPAPAPTREAEETIHRTLLLAQRAADEAVAEAQAEAARLVEEARGRAASVVADAEASARRLAEGERRRLEQEVLELAARREALLADVDALERFSADYRERLRRMLQEDLDTLTARAAVSLPRPTLHEVDLPGAGGAGPSPRAGASPGTGVTGAASGRTDVPPPAPPAPPVAEPAPAPPVATDPGAPTGELSLGEGTGKGAPAAIAGGAGAPGVGADPEPGPAATGVAGTDAAGSGRADTPPPTAVAPVTPQADPLDDDAFFASLRDAVRNPEPLGPRDAPPAFGEAAGGAEASAEEKAGGFFRRRR